MNRFVCAFVVLAVPWVVSCGGGGAGGSGSEALTPRGAECGVGPIRRMSNRREAFRRAEVRRAKCPVQADA